MYGQTISYKDSSGTFGGKKREKGRKLGIKEDTVFPSGWTEIWMLSNLNPSSMKVFGWGASATAAPVHST